PSARARDGGVRVRVRGDGSDRFAAGGSGGGGGGHAGGGGGRCGGAVPVRRLGVVVQARGEVALALALGGRGELVAREAHDDVGGAVEAEPIGIQTQVVVLVGAPRALPVRADVLFALSVGVVDHFLGFFVGNGVAARGAGDEGWPRRVAEDVQHVLARSEHRLRAASDDHRVAAARGVDDDALGNFDDPFLARRKLGAGGAGQNFGC